MNNNDIVQKLWNPSGVLRVDALALRLRRVWISAWLRSCRNGGPDLISLIHLASCFTGDDDRSASAQVSLHHLENGL